MLDNEITTKTRVCRHGQTSKMKKVLIEEAIKRCENKDKMNRFVICSKLADIMCEKYKGKNLEYHSKRMGMDSTLSMLKQIDIYFYRDFDIKQIEI